MLYLKERRHALDGMFVVALFTLFAITSLLFVLISARQYKDTADAMDQNYTLRTATSYLTEKVRQNDCAGSVSLTQLEGCDAIALTSSQGETSYTTYLYYYEGALRELCVSQDSKYSLSSGQEIVALSDCSMSQNSSCIYLELTDQDQCIQLYLPLKCSREEAL